MINPAQIPPEVERLRAELADAEREIELLHDGAGDSL